MEVTTEFSENPVAEKIVMIAGWRQWADAGAISSALPQYLIELTGARKIGKIAADPCYLFQIPGAHHFLRPRIKLEEGYRLELEAKSNEFYYSGDDKLGVVIFLGDEPHLRAQEYSDAFFAAVKQLQVERVAAVGGVYGEMPFDKDRDVSCIYSQLEMKEELSSYAVRFSNYEGGSTIGSYLVDKAEAEGVEFFVLYAFVPAYDFNQPTLFPQGVRIENDYKAWYDLMLRFRHMFGLGLDLSDLQEKCEELEATMDAQLEELAREMPQLKVSEYMEEMAKEFTERPFVALDDIWEQGLQGLFDDQED
jgi:predicted ATP-grasp superfamily ATP-dependent carboligase